MRERARKRRYVGQRRLTLLSPILRYSASRDAWVLKGVGTRSGPVFKLAKPE